jgi:hypothetical protein
MYWVLRPSYLSKDHSGFPFSEFFTAPVIFFCLTRVQPAGYLIPTRFFILPQIFSFFRDRRHPIVSCFQLCGFPPPNSLGGSFQRAVFRLQSYFPRLLVDFPYT